MKSKHLCHRARLHRRFCEHGRRIAAAAGRHQSLQLRFRRRWLWPLPPTHAVRRPAEPRLRVAYAHKPKALTKPLHAFAGIVMLAASRVVACSARSTALWDASTYNIIIAPCVVAPEHTRSQATGNQRVLAWKGAQVACKPEAGGVAIWQSAHCLAGKNLGPRSGAVVCTSDCA